MGAPKGTIPPNAGKGRPKGAKNKVNKDIRASLYRVYEDIGGDAGFAAWAGKEKNKQPFYKMIAGTAPRATEHTGADGGPIEHKHDVTVAMDTDKLTEAIRKARGK